MKWFGAPRGIAERGPWARTHPERASVAYALLLSGGLTLLGLLRTQQIEKCAAVFVGLFLFSYVCGRVAIALGARSLAKSQRADPPTP